MNLKRGRQLGAEPSIPAVCAGPGEPGLVSVLISTYNRAYILGKAIESVLAQSYRPFEVIVVDDGSTDDTRQVVDSFGPEVVYLYQSNQGLATARNVGLAAARGEFIAFQDSDDLWLPWKLEAQVALMRQLPTIALSWTDMTAVDSAGTVVRDRYLRTMYHVYETMEIEKYLPLTGKVADLVPRHLDALQGIEYRVGDIFDAMFLGSLVHPPTVLMRRTCVFAAGGLDLAFAWSCEDYEFLWRVSQHGPAALIEAPGMLYRVNASDQLTHPGRMLNKARGNLIAHERKLKSVNRPVHLPRQTIREQMADAYAWLAMEELLSQEGGRWRSVHYFLKSLVLNPMQKKTLVYFFLDVLLPGPLFGIARAAKQFIEGTADIGLS